MGYYIIKRKKRKGRKTMDLYQTITDQIIKKLEEGTVPWRKPYQSSGAISWHTQKPYRGINALMLDDGEYATFNQIKKAGGRVKKGEKSHLVIFWKLLQRKTEDQEETVTVPLMRYYRVFEINTQVEGLESRLDTEEYEHEPIERAEEIIKGYVGPKYTEEPGRAYYRPSTDTINIPPKKDFYDINEYYRTMFHEMGHSTGHKDRLNREGITNIATFGSETYSKEELVAEITASFLCGETRIINRTIENTTAYIQSWIRALKNDKTLITNASQQAQKATDFILGRVYE